MSAAIVARSETSFTIQVEIPYGSSMLDFEQVIQERLNQAGVVAVTGRFKTSHSSPISVAGIKINLFGPRGADFSEDAAIHPSARLISSGPETSSTPH